MQCGAMSRARMHTYMLHVYAVLRLCCGSGKLPHLSASVRTLKQVEMCVSSKSYVRCVPAVRLAVATTSNTITTLEWMLTSCCVGGAAFVEIFPPPSADVMLCC